MLSVFSGSWWPPLQIPAFPAHRLFRGKNVQVVVDEHIVIGRTDATVLVGELD
jgi:hypothetical protein